MESLKLGGTRLGRSNVASCCCQVGLVELCNEGQYDTRGSEVLSLARRRHLPVTVLFEAIVFFFFSAFSTFDMSIKKHQHFRKDKHSCIKN